MIYCPQGPYNAKGKLILRVRTCACAFRGDDRLRVAQDSTVDLYVPEGLNAVVAVPVWVGGKANRHERWKLHCPTYPTGKDGLRHCKDKVRHYSNSSMWSALFGLYDSKLNAMHDAPRFFNAVVNTEGTSMSLSLNSNTHVYKM